MIIKIMKKNFNVPSNMVWYEASWTMERNKIENKIQIKVNLFIYLLEKEINLGSWKLFIHVKFLKMWYPSRINISKTVFLKSW